MKDNSILKLVTSIATALLVSACGGGGGGNPNTSGDPNPNSPQQFNPSIKDLNGPLKGLYWESSLGNWLNLSTGESGQIYSDYTTNPTEIVTPSYDGREYVEIYVKDNLWGPGESTVIIKDMRTGRTKDRFTITGEISGYQDTKLSPDGEILQVRWDKGNDDHDYWISFFDRNGTRISSFANDEITAFDWLPENREFVFVKNKAIYKGRLEGSSILSSSQPIVSLSHLDGYPSRLKASRDGEKVAFEMVYKTPNVYNFSNWRRASVWRADINGSGPYLVAKQHNKELKEGKVNDPLWSLDSRFILMSAGVSSTTSVTWSTHYEPSRWDGSGYTGGYTVYDYVEDVNVFSFPGALYFFPYQLKNVEMLKSDSPLPAVMYQKSGKVVGYKILGADLEEEKFLVPVVPRMRQEPANLPSLGGSIYYLLDLGYKHEYSNKLTIMRYDLSTDKKSIYFQIDGSNSRYQVDDDLDDYHQDFRFDISKDKKYFTHYYDDAFEGDHLFIYDPSGNRVKTYYMYNDYSGREILSNLYFSPVNSSLLLYKLKDYNDEKRIKLSVLDWKNGTYKFMLSIDVDGFAWDSDGSLVFSYENQLHHVPYRDGDFQHSSYSVIAELPKAFRMTQLDISSNGEKILFVNSNRIFWCNRDGSNLTQITGLTYDWESAPKWSPDGKAIVLMKGEDRYVISADSKYQRVYEGMKTSNTIKHITDEGMTKSIWLP